MEQCRIFERGDVILGGDPNGWLSQLSPLPIPVMKGVDVDLHIQALWHFYGTVSLARQVRLKNTFAVHSYSKNLLCFEALSFFSNEFNPR